MGRRGSRSAGRPKPPAPPRPSKYPWELWTNGEEHTVIQGEDFDLPPRQFLTSIRHQLDVRFSHGLEVLEIDATSVRFRTFYRD
jgi:hypothetical protein